MKNALELLREMRSGEVGNRCDTIAPVVAPPGNTDHTSPSNGQKRQNRQNPGLPNPVWHWWSEVLAEEIQIAADDVNVQELSDASGLPVYTVTELRCLKGVSPECLRLIHQIKHVFGSDVLHSEEEPLQFPLLEV